MKKQFFILLSALFLFSCSGQKESKSVDTPQPDTQELAEPVETTPAIDEATIRQQFDNAIAIKAGKASKKWIGESEYPTISLPVTLTNNTDVTLSPSDYKITYSETYEATVNGELVDKTKTSTAEGPEIPANSSVEYTITKRTGNISKPKAALTLSFEDFASKFE